MVYDQRWKTARRNSFYVLARCNISIWTKSLPPLTDCDSSAAKIANWRHGGSWVEPLPITEKEWQVRHGDQPWYPHVLWPLRWTIAHSTWMVPLQFVIWYKPKTGKYTAKRGFTSVQMVHTHTHTLPQEGGKVRPRPWNDNEEERKWKWDEDENEMKIT